MVTKSTKATPIASVPVLKGATSERFEQQMKKVRVAEVL